MFMCFGLCRASGLSMSGREFRPVAAFIIRLINGTISTYVFYVVEILLSA